MPKPPPRSGYNPALDGFRSLGILAVIAYHLGLPSSQAGFLGVDIFFVLSGYLITSYLVSEWKASGGIQLRRFYVRRLLRLLPALCLMLMVCGFLAPRSDQVVTALGLSNWAMALNIVPGMNERFLVHTWSLASEWQYYLIWPPIFLVLMRSRLPRSGVALLVAALALASGIWRVILWDITGNLPRVHYALDSRSDGLLFGTAVALLLSTQTPTNRLRRWRPIRAATWLALLATLGLIAGGAPITFFLEGGQTVVVISATLLLCGVLVDPPKGIVRVLSNRVLVWIGKISYGLYLWHLPIHGYLQSVRGIDGGALILLTLALSFAAASLSYYLVEVPILRLKVHFGAASPVPAVRLPAAQ